MGPNLNPIQSPKKQNNTYKSKKKKKKKGKPTTNHKF